MTPDSSAPVYVVAGPPGAGKTTVAELIATRLRPAALLDKDTMYGGFVAAILAAAGRPHGEREGAWYDEHIKVHEYAGMAATAREIRTFGCPVVLCGPFTTQIHDESHWAEFVGELGGPPVRLVWVHIDAARLRERLVSRASPRDTQKLARFDEFVAATRTGQPPPVPHVAIDNRLDGTDHLARQVAQLI